MFKKNKKSTQNNSVKVKFKDKIKENHSSGYKKVAYYMSLKNLIADIEKMGFKGSIKKICGIILAYVAIAASVSIFMELNPICFIIMLFVGMLIVPLIILNAYKKIYEDNRFREVSQYIEQMLYSFKNTNKVLKSLKDIQPMFKDSPMGETIKRCINEIPDVGIEKALSNFEKIYDCQKIHQLNQFMIEVERVGGDHDNSINLLLQDRELWVNRTLEYKKERNHQKTTVFMAILMSFTLCVFMEKILPVQIDVTSNVFHHVSATLLFLLDLILFYMTDNFCSASILNNFKMRSDADIKKYYEYLVNYNAKKEFAKGVRMAAGGIFIVVFGLISKEMTYVFIGIIFSVFCLVKNKATYNTRFKVIKEEIEIQFPRWLMNMALYVQSNSVQVALYKSIPTAPLVLQPELIKLNNAIRENPVSVNPWLDFMKDFDVPDITASMTMFYSIASGAGANVQEQVNEIIKRNNALLDKTERIANDNLLARMYLFFLAPQLTGSFKIIVDMVIFFSTFMSSSMPI